MRQKAECNEVLFSMRMVEAQRTRSFKTVEKTGCPFNLQSVLDHKPRKWVYEIEHIHVSVVFCAVDAMLIMLKVFWAESWRTPA
jgi:hypothetical protein